MKTKLEQLRDLELELEELEINRLYQPTPYLLARMERVAEQIVDLTVEIAGVTTDELADLSDVIAERQRENRLLKERYSTPRPPSIADYWR